MASERNCIIPDHMLEHIVKSPVAGKLRDWAMRSLVMSARIRGQRDALSVSASATPAGRKHRMIYDAKHLFELPGELSRIEGQNPTGDQSVDEVYDGFGATYALFSEEYGRNSLDDQGHPLSGTVHFGEDYANAFWNGSQMVFGDGDGEIFLSFSSSLDVIGHELTHGIIDFTSQLVYARQPGALNESWADVFGSLVKQRVLNQTAEEADWLIGAGLFGPTVQGTALRSMKAPGTAYNDPRLGKDPQPDHMRRYDPTSRDNFGVHINSGIPNRAFYLVASRLGGHAWEDAGRMWYISLLRLGPFSQFQDAADITYQVAGQLYGDKSEEQQAVQEAWSEVGIRVTGIRGTARRAHKRVEAVAEKFDGHFEKLTTDLKRIIDAALHSTKG